MAGDSEKGFLDLKGYIIICVFFSPFCFATGHGYLGRYWGHCYTHPEATRGAGWQNEKSKMESRPFSTDLFFNHNTS